MLFLFIEGENLYFFAKDSIKNHGLRRMISYGRLVDVNGRLRLGNDNGC